MNKDFDLNKFVDMFDTAMNSDNPTVKKCFNNLLLVVAIAHAEDDINDINGRRIGPLRELVMKVNEMERKLSRLESLLNNQVNTVNTPYSPPTWVSTNTGNGYVPPNSGPYSIGSTSGSGYSTKFN